MPVTSIKIFKAAKPKPKAGDTKIIGGVLHERKMKRVRDTRGNIIGYDCTGGRQRYEWLPAGL